MRTQPAHIEPGCPWCNEDHNPDIQCRLQPESVRFQLSGGKRKPPKREVRAIKNASGQLLGVITRRV